jgi:hypothetical protein
MKEQRRGAAWTVASTPYAAVCLGFVLLALAGCASNGVSTRTGREVQSQYRDWTIAITPFSRDAAWRARVDISPSGRSGESQRRIRLHFTESAATEQAVVAAALQAARHHIDGLRLPAQ